MNNSNIPSDVDQQLVQRIYVELVTNKDIPADRALELAVEYARAYSDGTKKLLKG